MRWLLPFLAYLTRGWLQGLMGGVFAVIAILWMVSHLAMFPILLVMAWLGHGDGSIDPFWAGVIFWVAYVPIWLVMLACYLGTKWEDFVQEQRNGRS